ncbi:MAG: hypothetical protein LBN40_00920 [Oscillospiraceae bacterium]|nr:hypothetical protein [Oscillospiraceae bacterium]
MIGTEASVAFENAARFINHLIPTEFAEIIDYRAAIYAVLAKQANLAVIPDAVIGNACSAAMKAFKRDNDVRLGTFRDRELLAANREAIDKAAAFSLEKQDGSNRVRISFNDGATIKRGVLQLASERVAFSLGVTEADITLPLTPHAMSHDWFIAAECDRYAFCVKFQSGDIGGAPEKRVSLWDKEEKIYYLYTDE